MGGGTPPHKGKLPLWPQPSTQARLWRAIRRRPALHDIGDVDLLALQPHRLNHIVQQLSGLAHKRHAEASSSAPGPSPTNISRALASPSPNTAASTAPAPDRSLYLSANQPNIHTP